MSGAQDIADERQRQIEKKGWTAEHDDKWVNGELALAAACYATPRASCFTLGEYEPGSITFRDQWPWSEPDDKRRHHSRRERLVIAGALIAAEIDRLDREEGKPK